MYERIVDAVIEKRLRPGERINEAKLAAAYRLPRSRARRVLNRLVSEGLVQFEFHRGAFISLPSVEEAHHVFEARLHVEAAIARVASERIDAEGVRRLREHQEAERDGAQKAPHEHGEIAYEHIEVEERLDDVHGGNPNREALGGDVDLSHGRGARERRDAAHAPPCG